jgi:chromosome segregation ATPase
MPLFTAGNLITLAIVILVLVLFRQFDKGKRSLNMLSKYADKLKDDLAAYAAQKEEAVKSYGVSLDVEQQAARELMKQLQLTDQELADKAAAVAKIDERIHDYDTTLEELVQMTARVQENLGRLKEEAVFVEDTGAQVKGLREKLGALEKDLHKLEQQFERENAASLEKTQEAVIASIRSTVADLAAQAETIERKVEDHREAVDKIEAQRVEHLEKDQELIKETLARSLEEAGRRADKLEDAALLKLRDQAQDRMEKLKAALEEKIRTYQESAKAKVGEMQELFKQQRGEAKAVVVEFAAASKEQQQIWKQDIAEGEAARTELHLAIAAQKESFDANVDDLRKDWDRLSGELNAGMETHRQQWDTLAGDLQTKLTAQEQKWLEAASGMDEAAVRQQEQWKAQVAGFEGTLEAQRKNWDLALQTQFDTWHKTMNDAIQQALEESGQRLESYKSAQAEEFQRLAAIADDAARLEGELRRIMAEAESRVRSNFTRFEEEAAALRQNAASSFDAQVKGFQTTLANLQSELAELQKTAHSAVSKNLKDFEDEFFTDLAQRKADIDRRFVDWQEVVEQRLGALQEESLTQRKDMEASLAEESRKTLVTQGERLTTDLEHLRQETTALEAGIREEMLAADETRASFRAQITQDMEELRLTAESSMKVEIGRYTLSSQETIKQNQRDLEARLKEIAQSLESRSSEIAASQDRVRELAEENDGRVAQFRVDLDKAREEAAIQRQEILARTQEEAKALSAAVEEAERRIRDFTAQTKLFERTDELKTELERRIEDLRGDIDRLDQRKSEVAQMEGEFARIRRLGDEVGAKMNRFLLEQHRIEVMEADFNRLLQTSQAVEEKLAQVSDTDDTLEAVQVQIRRLEDALRETEEKYQRVERKNQTLEETNNGIARNFKALQESETTLAQVNQNLDSLSSQFGELRIGIETLAGENEKARETADKLGILDETLTSIEQRIKDMQKAREWLAGLETRMEEMYRQAQDHVKLAGDIVNRDPGPSRDDKSALTPAVRENVLKLARRGWTVKEISNSVKISEGAVELILEFATRDQ